MTKTLLAFIQDRSGSMSNAWQETLNGFNTYVESMKEDQAKGDVEYILSLTTFDTQIDAPYLGVPITSVDGGKLKDFGPRGGTALYDAVGKTLQALDDDKTITFDKAIVIICTDGEENQSREWNKDSLHAAIDERIKRGNWTFTYLGTQPETWGAATTIGVGMGASAVYNAQNAQATYATMAHASATMTRGIHAHSASFLHDNTSVQMRCAVGMATEDDTIPVAAGLGSIPLQSNTPPVRHTPRPTAPVSGRKWK